MTREQRHVDEGVWVRLLDGQAGTAERLWAAWHARGCAHCARQRAAMTRRVARLDALLSTDTSPRPLTGARPAAIPRTRRRTATRAAIAGLLLGGSAVAFAAIGPRLQAWRHTSRLEARGAAPAAPATPADTLDAASEVATTRVRFASEHDTLALSLSSAPSAGTLTIVRSANAGARSIVELSLEGPRGLELLLVPGGAHVALDRGRLDGVLRVPLHVRAVRIVVGDERRGRQQVIRTLAWPSGAAQVVPWTAAATP